MLFRMRRNHTRESYLELIHRIREKIPSVSLTADVIVGFCEETDQEFEDTLSLMQEVQFD